MRLGAPGVATSLLTSKPPYLAFLTLDNFKTNSSALTPDLKDKTRFLVRSVEASWTTNQPIVEIHLVGHTDSTALQPYNVALGDRRAKAVQQELLQYKSLAGRVLVVVDPSPGELKPTEANTTAVGKGRNRRVEVFVTFGVAPSPPPPTPPPPCIDPRKCIKEPPGSVIVTKPGPWTPIPPGRAPKSFDQWLDERLARLPKWIAWGIKKAVEKGTCTGLEVALGRAVGGLSDSEKDEIRRQCADRLKKPM